jgi:hypothetical protein
MPLGGSSWLRKGLRRSEKERKKLGAPFHPIAEDGPQNLNPKTPKNAKMSTTVSQAINT